MTFTRRNLIGAVSALLGGALLGGRVMAAERPPIVVKLGLVDGRVAIGAAFANRAPELFMIDTGAYSNFLAQGFNFDGAGLHQLGHNRSAGVGGAYDSYFYEAAKVVVGGAFQQNGMLFGTTNARLGNNIKGGFSASFLTAFDTDLDFEKGELRIYRDGRRDREGMQRLESRIKSQNVGSNKIFANVTLGSYPTELLLDTGAGGDAVLKGSAARRSGLWRDDQPYMPYYTHGVGEHEDRGRIVRVPKMRIGHFVFERPLVMLLNPNGDSAFEASGLLGLSAISRLNLSTDVKNKAIWAAPNFLDLLPSGYPASGVLVLEAGGGLKVVDVGFGSPAAAAGLAVGDLVVGRPVTYFQQMAFGQQVALDVDRKGKRMRIEYTLRDYL